MDTLLDHEFLEARILSYSSFVSPVSGMKSSSMHVSQIEGNKKKKRKNNDYRPCPIGTSNGDVSIRGNPSCCRELKTIP